MSVSPKRFAWMPQTGVSFRACRPAAGLGWGFSLISLAALVALTGCGKPSTPTTPPKAVAKSYLQAMISGNGAEVRHWSTGDEPSALVLIAQASQLAAQEKYVAAAKAKFGDAAPAMVGRRAADHPAIRLTTIDTEQETVDEQSAYIGQGPTKLYLAKTPSGWLVDRARLVPPSLTDPKPYVIEAELMRDVYDRVAADISAGHIATPVEAKTAIMGGIEQGLKKLYPATSPARS